MTLPDLLSSLCGKRGEKGLPSAVRYLPASVLRFIARRRRAQGFYDGRTLALYAAVWRRRRSASALLEYALFRRDLGNPLPKRWQTALAAALNRLRPASRRLALALLAESAPATLSTISEQVLAVGASHMAPLACYWQQHGGAGPDWLARLHEQQQAWRDSFAHQLRQSAQGGICLVGNSGSLRGAGQGNYIDSHDLVVRFNLCSGPQSEASDLGEKLDIWVGAPGFSGQPPHEVVWAISTGPDMRFRRQNWTPFKDRLLRDLPVLTVPLPIWRELVAECCAPPSAGILVLAWIRNLLGSWDGVSTVGIGIPPSSRTPYHHVVTKQLPFGRHDWERERALLSRWRGEGLLSFDVSSQQRQLKV